MSRFIVYKAPLDIKSLTVLWGKNIFYKFMEENKCPNCGSFIPSEAENCPKCGAMLHAESRQGQESKENQQSYQSYQRPYQSYQQQPSIPCPKTWLVESILATIFCCIPCGIVGIIYASQVSSNYAKGSYQEAVNSSHNAKMWTLIGAIVGFVGLILLIIISIVGGASGIAILSRLSSFA